LAGIFQKHLAGKNQITFRREQFQKIIGGKILAKKHFGGKIFFFHFENPHSAPSGGNFSKTIWRELFQKTFSGNFKKTFGGKNFKNTFGGNILERTF
jgi:hypothetical protein